MFNASSSACPSSTTFVASPHASACSDEIGLSKPIISIARATPTSRGSVNVPPPSMHKPAEVYACRRVADFAITRKSHAIASEKPPPAAIPLTAAITGFRMRRISSIAWWYRAASS